LSAIYTCPICNNTLFSKGREHSEGSWYMLYWCDVCGFYAADFGKILMQHGYQDDDVIAPEVIYSMEQGRG